MAPDLFQDALQTDLTVEFWVKVTPAAVSPPANLGGRHLLSIFFVDDDGDVEEYMRIGTDAGGWLGCRPFDGVEIEYPEFAADFLDEYRWFHISCRLEGGKRAVATISNSVNSTTYEIELEDSSFKLPAGQYRIRIGESALEDPGLTHMPIKEVRVWSEFRSDEQLEKFRYKKLDPTRDQGNPGSLEAYLTLAENSYQFINLAALAKDSTPSAVGARGFGYESGETAEYEESGVAQVWRHVVCPVGTVHASGACFTRPIKEAVAAVLATTIAGELEWTLTPEFTPFIDESVWDGVEVRWELDDPLLTQLLDLTSKTLQIPQRAVREEATYQVRLQLTSEALSLDETVSFNFVPASCRYFTVDGLDAPDHKEVLQSTPGRSDLAVNLTLKFN